MWLNSTMSAATGYIGSKAADLITLTGAAQATTAFRVPSWILSAPVEWSKLGLSPTTRMEDGAAPGYDTAPSARPDILPTLVDDLDQVLPEGGISPATGMRLRTSIHVDVPTLSLPGVNSGSSARDLRSSLDEAVGGSLRPFSRWYLRRNGVHLSEQVYGSVILMEYVHSAAAGTAWITGQACYVQIATARAPMAAGGFRMGWPAVGPDGVPDFLRELPRALGDLAEAVPQTGADVREVEFFLTDSGPPIFLQCRDIVDGGRLVSAGGRLTTDYRTLPRDHTAARFVVERMLTTDQLPVVHETHATALDLITVLDVLDRWPEPVEPTRVRIVLQTPRGVRGHPTTLAFEALPGAFVASLPPAAVEWVLAAKPHTVHTDGFHAWT